MVHSVIPATWEVEIGRLKIQGQSEQKVRDPLSVSKLSTVIGVNRLVHVCNLS
jgi:hypothetical protein